MQPAIKQKLDSYPKPAAELFIQIRTLILDLIEELDLGQCEETLKWGEPSFSVKTGSPIRLDWKEKNPEYIGLYFNCNTQLVVTFRELYSHDFEFNGNREIKLPLTQPLKTKQLAHCLQMALTYKKIKHLPLLGN